MDLRWLPRKRRLIRVASEAMNRQSRLHPTLSMRTATAKCATKIEE
jgi:hypothetical protein